MNLSKMWGGYVSSVDCRCHLCHYVCGNKENTINNIYFNNSSKQKCLDWTFGFHNNQLCMVVGEYIIIQQ